MGEQHFKGVSHFDRRKGRPEQRKRYDNLKAQKLKEQGITLIYFKHDEELTEENVKKKLIKKYIPC